MAEIRLRNLTKVYRPSRFKLFSSGGGRRTYKEYQDKALVERLAGQEVATGTSSEPVHALDDMSLTIRDGETLSVVGPSGCGKSTLLRVVAGLEELDRGHVFFDDKDVTGLPAKDRGVGMVFQSYALYPHMQGQGNLAFFFKVRQRPSEEVEERIRITSEIMGIGFDELLARKPPTLSGGQQQRVAIGRCIVRDPSLFLFDEPLSNLDAKLRSSTRVEIKRLLHRFDITAMYVTHDQTEGITLGDRIAVMRAGKIEQVGTYQEITHNPINAFVAGFLGLPPMNLLHHWQPVEGTLRSAYGEMPIPVEVSGGLGEREICVGFRTEDGKIATSDESVPSGHLLIAGRVINCEPHFAERHQVINVEADEIMLAVQAPLDLEINAGWKVHVIVSPDDVYLFDEASGTRLYPVEGR